MRSAANGHGPGPIEPLIDGTVLQPNHQLTLT
jgi:hypothetical protein